MSNRNFFRIQNGQCAICEEPPAESVILCVDHNHNTKQVRGLLCRMCNCAVGNIRERLDFISRLVKYLGGHPEVIKFRRTSNHSLPLPSKATPGSSGFDMRAVSDVEWIQRGSVHQAIVDLGFAIQLPIGFDAHIHPRSGLAAKHLVTVLNTPGVIDNDYTGSIQAILICHGTPPALKAGDRVCQLLVQRVHMFTPVEVDTLSETERGTGGFGSTGVA